MCTQQPLIFKYTNERFVHIMEMYLKFTAETQRMWTISLAATNFGNRNRTNLIFCVINKMLISQLKRVNGQLTLNLFSEREKQMDMISAINCR